MTLSLLMMHSRQDRCHTCWIVIADHCLKTWRTLPPAGTLLQPMLQMVDVLYAAAITHYLLAACREV